MKPVHCKIDCVGGEHLRIMSLERDSTAICGSDAPVIATRAQVELVIQALADAAGLAVIIFTGREGATAAVARDAH